MSTALGVREWLTMQGEWQIMLPTAVAAKACWGIGFRNFLEAVKNIVTSLQPLKQGAVGDIGGRRVGLHQLGIAAARHRSEAPSSNSREMDQHPPNQQNELLPGSVLPEIHPDLRVQTTLLQQLASFQVLCTPAGLSG